MNMMKKVYFIFSLFVLFFSFQTKANNFLPCYLDDKISEDDLDIISKVYEVNILDEGWTYTISKI